MSKVKLKNRANDTLSKLLSMLRMTETRKRKVNSTMVVIYRSLSFVGIAVILFNSGAWKKDIEDRAFDTPKEKYELFETIKDNTAHRVNTDLHMPKEEKDLLYVKRAEFDKAILELITSMKRIESKIDNNNN